MAAKAVSHRLAVLGDGGVGKTALTIRFIMQHFVETVSVDLQPAVPELPAEPGGCNWALGGRATC